MLDEQPSSQPISNESPQKQTLASLIDSIDFEKKSKPKSTFSVSDGDSLSSGHQPENKEKSKIWTPEEVQLFHILLKKYGTDFHILSNFFPRKTKSQLKNRYKQYISVERKREKEQVLKLKALSQLFKEKEEKEEKEEKQEKGDKGESWQQNSKSMLQ